MPPAVLTINSGSSSLKYALFEAGTERQITGGAARRIGLAGGEFPDHAAALDWLFASLRGQGLEEIAMAGHRLVYGGRAFTRPHEITAELIEALRQLIPFAPEHLPHELAAVEAVRRSKPHLRQYACFDTAFHAARPEIAHRIPIPRDLWDEGVVRYGFHGLSYAYIMEELAREAGAAEANGRVLIAHLGNGASMAAVHGGRPVDTTMGFTPTGGLMMGTRSGDLDPGVLLYLQEEKGLPAQAVRDIVNRRSGLAGVSGISSDMQDLLKRAAGDARAAEAIALYCYQARKFLGALAAVMGGLDTLIFTAGIGENAPEVRAGICQGLEFLGVRVDAERNRGNQPVISAPEGRVTVRVMQTDEDRMIARHARDFLA